jgi:NitT/TauT family transport system permease protein
MASAFRVPQKKIILTLRIPAALPYFLGACRSAVGLGFKAGVAAEVLALPAHSIGTAIYESRLYLSTNELFAYTLAVILLGVLFERLTLLLLPQKSKEVIAHAHD